MRFRRVVPFTVVTEVSRPVHFPFQGQTQLETGFNDNMCLQSFKSISNAAAAVVVDELRRQADTVAESATTKH